MDDLTRRDAAHAITEKTLQSSHEREREPHQPVPEETMSFVALSAKVLYCSPELRMIFRIGLKGETLLNGFPGLSQARRTCHGAHRMFEHRAAGHNPKVDASSFS